ncbi:hypothetical protein CCACVL1_11913, partial [Corchorus capsularis]
MEHKVARERNEKTRILDPSCI